MFTIKWFFRPPAKLNHGDTEAWRQKGHEQQLVRKPGKQEQKVYSLSLDLRG
jgi:hypothetical protein